MNAEVPPPVPLPSAKPSWRLPTNVEKFALPRMQLTLLYDRQQVMDEEQFAAELQRRLGEELTELRFGRMLSTVNGVIELGHDKIQFSAARGPLDAATVRNQLQLSFLGDEDKAQFAGHATFALITYLGECASPRARVERMHQVAIAYCLAVAGATSVLNEVTENIIPVARLLEIDGEKMAEGEHILPYSTWLLWTGGCRVIQEGEKTYYFCKGPMQFGFTCLWLELAAPHTDAYVTEIFKFVFSVMLHENFQFLHGDILDVEGYKYYLYNLPIYLQLKINFIPTIGIAPEDLEVHMGDERSNEMVERLLGGGESA